MTYIIQEIQTDNGTTALLPALVYYDSKEAESAYHTKLGYAALSNIELHVVAMSDEYGNLIKNEWYKHRPVEQEEE